MKNVTLLFVIIMFSTINLFSQDTILLSSGNEIKVKVFEIDNNMVKYKRYDNLNGPMYSKSTNEINLIRYENGQEEIFNKTSLMNENASKQKEKPIITFERAMPKTDVRSRLSEVPYALAKYNSAQNLKAVEIILTVPFGPSFGWFAGGLVYEIITNDVQPTTLLMTGITGIGYISIFVVRAIRQNLEAEAFEYYKKEMEKNIGLSFNSNGIGLEYRFQLFSNANSNK